MLRVNLSSESKLAKHVGVPDLKFEFGFDVELERSRAIEASEVDALEGLQRLGQSEGVGGARVLAQTVELSEFSRELVVILERALLDCGRE